jgi:hypothetical protein
MSELKSLCDNHYFSSGHGFNRAVTAAKSARLQPLTDEFLRRHTGSEAPTP